MAWPGPGHIVNLISSDLEKLQKASPGLHFGYISPLETLLVFALLVRSVGWLAALAGVGVLLALVIPTQVSCAHNKRAQALAPACRPQPPGSRAPAQAMRAVLCALAAPLTT